jgi:hypothetical protein
MKNYRSRHCFFKTAFVLISIFSFAIRSNAQLSVTPGVTPSQLVSSLLGGGLNVSNITLNCP